MKAAGEIYFIGEKDLRSKEVTPYFKVGIVRENPENADRDSTQRLLEHQTGNPRELYIESVVKTELVELVETLLHKKFAPLGVRGEWMLLTASELADVQKEAQSLAKEAAEIIAQNEFHSLPVCENGTLVGIVTTTDLLKFLIYSIESL